MALPDAVVNNSVKISQVAGQKIDQAFIGSCANGTLDDLEVAAKVVQGRKVARGTRFIVTPSTEAIRFSRVSSVSLTRVVPDPASYVPGVTMPSEVILTIGWNVLSHVELEPAHCGDETCEADHGYLGTITADDLTLRVSAGGDGEEAVRQVLSFVSALSDATARTGS